MPTAEDHKHMVRTSLHLHLRTSSPTNDHITHCRVAEIKQLNFKYPIGLVCHIAAKGPSCFIYPLENDDPYFATAHHQQLIDQNKAYVTSVPDEWTTIDRTLIPSTHSSSGMTTTNTTTNTDDKRKSPPRQQRVQREFLLVPLRAASQKQEEGENPSIPVFAIYDCSQAACDFLLGRILSPRRLPLILDLDETLVKATTLRALEAEAAVTVKALLKVDHDQTLTPLEKMSLQKAILTATANAVATPTTSMTTNITEIDYAALKLLSVPTTNTIKFYETSFPVQSIALDTAPLVQPPRRLVDAFTQFNTVFIDVEPTRGDAYMAFRFRPYWNLLSQALYQGSSGGGSAATTTTTTVAPSPLVETYVCTTALNGYALEVWKLLDKQQKLIPEEQCRLCTACIACVPHCHSLSIINLYADASHILTDRKAKSLAQTLGLTTDTALDPVSSPVSPMPLAVIIDDRSDVWEPSVAKQVYKVKAWDPYVDFSQYQFCAEEGGGRTPRDQYRLYCNESPNSRELLKVGGVLRALHARVFEEIEGKMLPAMGGGNVVPTVLDVDDLNASYDKAMPGQPWVEDILPNLILEAPELDVDTVADKDVEQTAAAAEEAAAVQRAVLNLPPEEDHLHAAIEANAAAAAAAQLENEALDLATTNAAANEDDNGNGNGSESVPPPPESTVDDVFSSWMSSFGAPPAASVPVAASVATGGTKEKKNATASVVVTRSDGETVEAQEEDDNTDTTVRIASSREEEGKKRKKTERNVSSGTRSGKRKKHAMA